MERQVLLPGVQTDSQAIKTVWEKMPGFPILMALLLMLKITCT